MSKPYESFDLYVKRVFKAVANKDAEISSDAVAVLGDVVSELIDDLHNAMDSVIKSSRQVTLDKKVAEASTRLVLPGEMGKHAISFAQNAILKFEKSKTGTKTKRTDRSARAELNMSVARVEKALDNHHFDRISPLASVFTAAVAEHVLIEILEFAIAHAKEQNRVRISPRDISMAIASDEELQAMIKTDIIKMGGVAPHINSALQKK